MNRAGHYTRLAIALAVVAILLSGCATRALRRSDTYRSFMSEPLRPPSADLSYDLQGDTHVIRVSGDEYAMGYLYGQKARELGVADVYRKVLGNFTEMVRESLPAAQAALVGHRTARALLLDAWALMEPHVPAYAARMLQGFADGAGLDIRDVHAMHAIPDVTETSCSAVWATGTATSDGAPLQIRLLDYIMGLGIQAYPAVVFYEFHTGHTVANIGWLGLLGVISGMNDAGLAVSEMGYGNPPGETLHGQPMPFLLLDLLRWTDDPREAAGIIKAAPRTNSYVYIVGSAQRGGLAFATNAYDVVTVEPGQTDAIVAQFPDMLHAGHYQDRMDEMLAERHGDISMEWLTQTFIPAVAMRSSLQCVIYDLAHGRFLVSNAHGADGRASDQPYREFKFR